MLRFFQFFVLLQQATEYICSLAEHTDKEDNQVQGWSSDDVSEESVYATIYFFSQIL